jgi:Rrf2 family protein
MLSLAQQYPKGPIYLNSIAAEEDLSMKYLSRIVIQLRSANLVNSFRGAYGGYSLSRDPSTITMKELIDVLEGDVTLVNCVRDPAICQRAHMCVTRDIWDIITGKIYETLETITLADLVKKVVGRQNKIEGGGLTAARNSKYHSKAKL